MTALAAGCADSSGLDRSLNAGRPVESTAAERAGIPPEAAAATIGPTDTPAPTGNEAVLPQLVPVEYRHECNAFPQMPAAEGGGGKLVLQDRRDLIQLQLLDPRNGSLKELHGPAMGEERPKVGAGTASDGSHLSFVVLDQLVVTDAYGAPIAQLPWPDPKLAPDWAGNEWLVYALVGDGLELTSSLPNPMRAISAGLADDHSLRTQLPDILAFYPRPDWQGGGQMTYSPDLTWVAYLRSQPGRSPDGPGLLAVRRATDDAAEAQIDYVYWYVPPVWSRDGSRIAAVVNHTPSESDAPGLDTYDVVILDLRAGTLEQVTNTAEDTRRAFLVSLSWSPRGDMIAFWVLEGRRSTSELAEPVLYLADLEEHLVIDTCITTESHAWPEGLRPAVWSPDGGLLAAESASPDGSRGIAVLDPVSGMGQYFEYDAIPIGWLSGE